MPLTTNYLNILKCGGCCYESVKYLSVIHKVWFKTNEWQCGKYCVPCTVDSVIAKITEKGFLNEPSFSNFQNRPGKEPI